MISDIVKYELHYWKKQYAIYFYGIVLFFIGMSAMLIGGDILNEVTPNPNGERIINSSLSLYANLFGQVNILLFFLIPSIYGVSIYRDFKSKMYMVLYSYPVSKWDYWIGKYVSASIIAILLVGLLGVGAMIGENMPGLNPAFVGPFRPMAYFNIYAIYTIPTILAFGAIVFSIVGLSRNIYSGYVIILVIILLRFAIISILRHPDYMDIMAITDPYASITGMYYSKDWTLIQQNTMLLPLKGVVVLNRLLYATIGLCVFYFGYSKFGLLHLSNHSKWFRKKSQKKQLSKIPSGNLSLPTNILYSHNILYQWKATWLLSMIYFKSILKNKMFIALMVGCLILLTLILGSINPEMTANMRPYTQVILHVPSMFYMFLITLLVFIYSGYFVHQSRSTRMNTLIDSTPTSTWVLLGSKFLALIKIQMVLLSVVFVVGIIVQTYRGHYDYNLGQYFFYLYGLSLTSLVIWSALAFFVQTLIPNLYLATFVLILGWFGISGLSDLGVTEMLLRFNDTPVLVHSDFTQYGASLIPHLIYRGYWLLFGFGLLMLTYLLWIRGSLFNIKQRMITLKRRSTPFFLIGLAVLFVSFITLGSWVFISSNQDAGLSKHEMIDYKIELESQLLPYMDVVKPRLQIMNINFDIFPESRSFICAGLFTYENTSSSLMDTIWVDHSKYNNFNFEIDQKFELLFVDSVLNFSIINLERPIEIGSQIEFRFKFTSLRNTPLVHRTQVVKNGTFIMPEFPGLGFKDFRIGDSLKRVDANLSVINEEIRWPEDSINVDKSYVHEDLLHYEATVSTEEGQIAIANGRLESDWIEGDRHYYKYVNDTKIRNGFIFHSGSYNRVGENYNGTDLEIYHHPDHDYNVGSMMRSMKATLDYCQQYYGPYQFNDMKIIEFPRSYGGFAQSFARTISYSEQAGFMTNIDTSTSSHWDSPFRLTAHEMSHQWWGHQVVPALALGSKFVTEGLAEYTAAMILGRIDGKVRLDNFIEMSQNRYLNSRSRKEDESPLVYVKDDEGIVAYHKGCFGLYSLSQYLGEEILNRALGDFNRTYKLQGPPYATSLDLVRSIRSVTPDSLQYLVTDQLENVVMYDNRVLSATRSRLGEDSSQIDIKLQVSKYESRRRNERSYKTGFTISNNINGEEVKSLVLSDYIMIYFMSINDKGEEVVLEGKMLKITDIISTHSFVVKGEVSSVILDKDRWLLDADRNDNKKAV